MVVIPRWLFALTLYVLIIYLIIRLQPALMFDTYGKPKDFGIGFKDGKSVFAPVVIFPVIAILCYFISSIIQFTLS
jgi:hypothetical protein